MSSYILAGVADTYSHCHNNSPNQSDEGASSYAAGDNNNIIYLFYIAQNPYTVRSASQLKCIKLQQ